MRAGLMLGVNNKAEREKYFKKKGNRYTGGTQFYAWFVFKKNYKGDTKVLWI